MSTINTIDGTDKVGDSRTDINTNFSNLNTDKLEAGDAYAGNLEPDGDATRSFGAAALQWLKGWFDTVAARVLDIDNTAVDAAETMLDLKNFAQQGLGGEASTVVTHDYTDAAATVQLDKVGSGIITKLVNANNDTARADKEAGYVGDAIFASYHTFQSGLGNVAGFQIQSDYALDWVETDSQAKIKCNNATATFAYSFQADNATKFVAEYRCGGLSVMNVSTNSTTPTQCRIQSGGDMTGGLRFDAQNGNLDLRSQGGLVTFYDGVSSPTLIIQAQEAWCTFSGTLNLGNSVAVPTSDPSVAGMVWSNSGVLTLSAG